MNIQLILDGLGELLSVIISHQDISDADKARLTTVIASMNTLQTKEQNLADGKNADGSPIIS